MTQAWSQWEGHVVGGKFQLKKFLGGSDQSAVFLTADPERENQPAAIKMIVVEPANVEPQLARWGLAQRLWHRNLIRILHTGRLRAGTRELVFAVMDYAEEDLAQIIPERALKPQEAREMLGPVLDALTYLHGQGYVHGHLKPANVMAIQDQLKLASDGICRISEKVSDPASPYDPPELPGGVRSPAADVWSLGMTLCEALTQKRPSWSEQDLADPAVPESLPAPFLEIVRGCLRRDPQRRLTVSEIAARLWLAPQSGSPQPHVVTSQSAPRAIPAEPLPQRPPIIPAPAPARPARSRSGSPLQRFALPSSVAVLAVAALIAVLGWLRRPPAAHPHSATAHSERRTQPQEPTAVRPEHKVTAQAKPVSKPSPKSSPYISSKPKPVGESVSSPAVVPPVSPQPVALRTGAPVAATETNGLEGAVVHPVLPDVPPSASNTIHGTVRVSVKINVAPSGNVSVAELQSAGPSRYFARLSLEAAQKWQFAPSPQDAAREFVLHFEYRNNGPKAFATRAGS